MVYIKCFKKVILLIKKILLIEINHIYLIKQININLYKNLLY